MSDLIDHEANGLLVPAADATVLGNAVDRLRSSADLRRTLGLRAQESARRYTWDLIARQLEQVFQLAVDSRRQTRSI
jgi:glycosyltransferase involved in cell wall biosynthesis